MDTLAALPWKKKDPVLRMEEGEQLLLETRHHWMKYVFPTGIYVLLVSIGICALVFAGVSQGAFPGVPMVSMAALAASLIVHNWFFHFILSENATDVIITSKRIVLLSHRLWFEETCDELVLERIRIVEVHRRGFLRNVFNYGDLSCLFDVNAGKTFYFIPNPKKWAGAIERIIHRR